MARTNQGGGDASPEEDLDLGPEENEDDAEIGNQTDETEDDEIGDGHADDEQDEEKEGDVGGDPRLREDAAPRRTRAESTIARLRRERREEREANADLRRRLDGLERSQQQSRFDPEAARRAREEEERYLETLPPAEALKRVRDSARQEFGGALQQMEARMLEQADKREFAALCRTDKVAARFAGRVEELIAKERQAGNFRSTREDALRHLYGDEMLRRAREVTPRQRAQAQRRVRGQQVRPASGRGDVARARGSESEYEAALRRTRGQPL